MKVLYVAYCTEYEKGWGSRPDGLILTEEKSVIEEEIKSEYTKGSPEYYWRYSTAEKVLCDYETWDKIKDDFKKGIYHSSLNSLKGIGNFFKEV